jgi:HD-GYP domain-containing protein (c-di-GMP phosphodiesterase class II)
VISKKISVDELEFGMYVTQLDRPWTETPFLFQGFILREPEQLETLRKFCKDVYVDVERSELPDETRRALLTIKASAAPTGIRQVEHVERTNVEAELPRAATSYEAAQSAWEAVAATVSGGGELDGGAIQGAVKDMSASVMRNPDALVLFSALKERGGYFLGRAMNTSIYMIMFARFLGMTSEDIERAGLVGLLQDIGMLQVPDDILSKTGPLSPDEQKLVRGHVQSGAEILHKTAGLPPEVAKVVELHHERHDGSGYPRGLSHEDLGTIGACAGIIDTFSAMTTKRPYAEAIAPSNALGMLHKWRDKSFHPLLIEEFIRCIGVFPVGSVVELNSGEVGIVISQNVAKRLQPRVMVVRDIQGNPIRPQKLIDLSRSPKISEEETYRIRRTLEYGRSGVGLKDIML